MCASSSGAIMHGLECYLREQTCSNLENIIFLNNGLFV